MVESYYLGISWCGAAGLDVRKAARLRQLLLAGEALSADLIQRTQLALPNCRIINGYGPTEASVIVSAQSFSCGVPPELPVSIGRPLTNVKIFILDENLRPTPVGVAGELCVAGHCVARGCEYTFFLNPFL